MFTADIPNSTTDAVHRLSQQTHGSSHPPHVEFVTSRRERAVHWQDIELTLVRKQLDTTAISGGRISHRQLRDIPGIKFPPPPRLSRGNTVQHTYWKSPHEDTRSQLFAAEMTHSRRTAPCVYDRAYVKTNSGVSRGAFIWIFASSTAGVRQENGLHASAVQEGRLTSSRRSLRRTFGGGCRHLLLEAVVARYRAIPSFGVASLESREEATQQPLCADCTSPASSFLFRALRAAQVCRKQKPKAFQDSRAPTLPLWTLQSDAKL